MTRYNKTLLALAGFLTTWSTTYFPDDPDVQKYVGLAAGIATVCAVYLVPNTPPVGKPRDPNISEAAN